MGRAQEESRLESQVSLTAIELLQHNANEDESC